MDSEDEWPKQERDEEKENDRNAQFWRNIKCDADPVEKPGGADAEIKRCLPQGVIGDWPELGIGIREVCEFVGKKLRHALCYVEVVMRRFPGSVSRTTDAPGEKTTGSTGGRQIRARRSREMDKHRRNAVSARVFAAE